MDTENIQRLLGELQTSANHPKAEAHIGIKTKEIYCYFRPVGFGINEPCIIGYGKEPEAAIADAEAKWAEMRARVQADTTRKIALAIIRITHERGSCTDAALRAEFECNNIGQWAADAVKLANEMADSGPFEIVELAGANAA